MKNRILILALVANFLFNPLAGQTDSVTGEPALAEDSRIEALEHRLSSIEQKLRILGADSDDALMQPVGEFLSSPRKLLDKAIKEFQSRNFEEAYRWAMLLHVLHPEDALDREALEMARISFMAPYDAERMTHSSNRWRGHERRLMYAWLHGRMERDDFSPDEFRAFFTGMNGEYFYGFFGSRERVQEINGWRIEADIDNGRVNEIVTEKME